jgi:hypothetical protein
MLRMQHNNQPRRRTSVRHYRSRSCSCRRNGRGCKVEVKAATAPYISTTVRNPIVDKASYLEHSVRAKLGSEESRMYVAAAADTTDNAGLVPTRQLTEVINGISNADRPFIDSVSRGALPDAGMTFRDSKDYSCSNSCSCI